MIGCQSYPFVLFVRSVVKATSYPIQAPRRNAHASRYGKSFTPTSLFTLHNSSFSLLSLFPWLKRLCVRTSSSHVFAAFPTPPKPNRLRMSGDAHPYPQQAIHGSGSIPARGLFSSSQNGEHSPAHARNPPNQVGRIVLNEPLFFRAFRVFRGSISYSLPT